MEYLIPAFHEFLNEEGDVDVAGFLFRGDSMPNQWRPSHA